MTTTATKSSKPRKKRGGGQGPITGFAYSIRHYITGQVLRPKTAKCFPLHARRKKPPPEQLPLPLPGDEPTTTPESAVSEVVTTEAAAEPSPAPEEQKPPRRRRTPPTPRR